MHWFFIRLCKILWQTVLRMKKKGNRLQHVCSRHYFELSGSLKQCEFRLTNGNWQLKVLSLKLQIILYQQLWINQLFVDKLLYMSLPPTENKLASLFEVPWLQQLKGFFLHLQSCVNYAPLNIHAPIKVYQAAEK